MARDLASEHEVSRVSSYSWKEAEDRFRKRNLC